MAPWTEVIQDKGTKKCGGRPKITLVEVVRKYMAMKEAREGMI